MDSVELIKLVRKHEVLYTSKHPDYMNHQKKAAIWEKIGEALNQPGITCKNRWFGIKDTYRRIVKKELNNELGKPYIYDVHLTWLKPFLTDNKFIATNEQIEEEENVDEDDDSRTLLFPKFDELYYVEPDIDETMDKEQGYLQQSETTEELDWKEEGNSISNDSQSFQTKLRKRKIDSSNNANATKIFKSNSTATKKSEVIIEKKTIDDPIDAFLNGISSTIKCLSPYNQSLAKRNIFRVVNELEMAEIMKKTEDKKT